jgi:CCR4-NOT transcription complex subunit 4
MWCWHRIREQETGLCPACRTPYGDDPHAFSAVDVEEVLKANKEKEAAAKRERLKVNLALGESAAGVGLEAEIGFRGTGTMELPKDRTQLANMRVIRRNLVYAVGLSPAIASEDILRKPEYFGQYGKISKIVLNRGNITTPPVPTVDPRRLSASAYVTFVHKVRASPTMMESPANVFVSLCFNPLLFFTFLFFN